MIGETTKSSYEGEDPETYTVRETDHKRKGFIGVPN